MIETGEACFCRAVFSTLGAVWRRQWVLSDTSFELKILHEAQGSTEEGSQPCRGLPSCQGPAYLVSALAVPGPCTTKKKYVSILAKRMGGRTLLSCTWSPFMGLLQGRCGCGHVYSPLLQSSLLKSPLATCLLGLTPAPSCHHLQSHHLRVPSSRFPCGREGN